MNCWQYLIFLVTFYIVTVYGAVILNDDDVDAEGLYSKSEHVNILTGRNFERKTYGQSYAQLIQFYNSYCGHCRSFAPKYKTLAFEILLWKKVIQLSVIDCFNEVNNAICRDFEVMAYPTLRYIHEHYTKGNGNIGDKLHVTDTADKLKIQILSKMQIEQESKRLRMAPTLAINSYVSYAEILLTVPQDTRFTFLIFENANSSVGAELVLDCMDYQSVKVKRIQGNCELSQTVGIREFPSIVVLNPPKEPVNITPQNSSTLNLFHAIKNYLKTQGYKVPEEILINQDPSPVIVDNAPIIGQTNVVYYSDLEKTLKTTLLTEITKFKAFSTEQRNALLDYLEVLRDDFPFKGNDNLKTYLSDLVIHVRSLSEWKGGDLYKLFKSLEAKYNPYRSSDSDYIACKGSQPKYRGFTCGLWTLFHSLTVGAASKPDSPQEGQKVLKTLYNYVKYFFGCTHCSEHFKGMALRNRLFDVKDNDKAVLWLWISHNEVNLRLAGEVTEDPEYPKIQFPSQYRCPECRLARGAWNLPVVYQYLLSVYGGENIQHSPHSPLGAPNMFSQLDIGMLSFLYILSFFILILVIRFSITHHLYKKRFYKHGWGKV